MKQIIEQLTKYNTAAVELVQSVVVISAFLNKGDANEKQQRYFTEQLSNAVDKFNNVVWPEES